ncbi:MAG TPA: hypothetical protein DCO77_10650 [Nitrospiraceae bacterium]|nr:hypothetical protein [Nitrospiraceae bacterium]
MKSMGKVSLVLVALVMIISACGGGDDGTPPGPSAPKAVADPVSGVPIGTDQSIVVLFDKSMDTATLNLGVFGLGATIETWSSTAKADDTLTITPDTAWTTGQDKMLYLNIDDTDGLSLLTLFLIYDVLNVPKVAHYYVSDTSGNDANSGTSPQQPMKSIPAAISAAGSGSYVHVAAGTYRVDSSAGTHIILKDGLSLFGGYAADFSSRNVQSNVTSIIDESTATGVSNVAIAANAGITSATVVDGFTVTGGSGTASSAIRTNNASPLIRNNILNGGTGASSYGVWISNGSTPLIQDNTINGGSATDWAHGIYTENSSPTIERNHIDGGTSSGTFVFGIYTTNAGGMIRNNTINGGSGQNTRGIMADGTVAIKNNTVNGGSAVNYSAGISYVSGAVAIENNIVFTTSGSYRLCIFETQGLEDPANLDNNDLFDCPTSLYVDFAGVDLGDCSFNDDFNCLTDIADVNNLSDISGVSSGNVSDDPLFVDQAGGDWHLTPTSPATISLGGLDLSVSFDDDKDGTTRTDPWSIGVYEANFGPKMFLTLTSHLLLGYLNSIDGADAFCSNTDFGNPGTGMYKAMVVDGVNRIASVTADAGDGQVDWVLKPDTSYFRLDGVTLIGTTNAQGLLNFPLTNSVSTGGTFWSGLSDDWTTNANTCTGWMDGTAGVQGATGSGSATTISFLQGGIQNCDVLTTLLCVEIPAYAAIPIGP